ncbi:MAG: GvpL/GvpF family gas vesicle protein [Bacteroidota bacterium]
MTATKQGIYIYGIIQTSQDRIFHIEGLQNEQVSTIGFDGLAAVTSTYEFTDREYVKSSRTNMLTHQKVLELVMEEFSVLPFSFGTIANTITDVNNLITNRYTVFQKNFNYIEGRVELGVKGLWKEPDKIFASIAANNEEIKSLKAHIQKTGDQSAMIEVGKKVAQLLQAKKESMAEEIYNLLRRSAVDFKLNQTVTDAMFLNASFLVEKSREIEFDNLMEEIGEKYAMEVDFKYVGPLPAYNFIDLSIELEEWEK